VTAGPPAYAGGRLRVGLVGTGVIAQVMHLHYLTELADRFEIAAVCDLAPDRASACAGRYGVPAVFTDWREMLRHPLDAILVLTSGSHAPIAVAAAQAGLHVFTEKPMCYSAAEGRDMVAAAQRAGVTLMVGYPKRYDPAYARFQQEAAQLSGAKLMRVTTFESPLRSYIAHYPLLPAQPPPAAVAQRLRDDAEVRVRAAIGPASELEREVYEGVLLDTLVHELNAIRGVLGEPDRLDYVSLDKDTVTVMLRFGTMPVALHWVDLPGISRYEMEFSLYAPDRRVRLAFPSPFLRNEPAILEIEDGDKDSVRSWRTEEVVSYESGFKRELAAFADCAAGRGTPVTSGEDGLRDIALCEAIIECHRRRAPVGDPAGAGRTT
jgi:predicted dehydrogenase